MLDRTKYKNKLNTNKGVTLVALIITILVLLILARSGNINSRTKWINKKSRTIKI